MSKVLIVDLCYEKESLYFKEFVLPVLDIVRKSGSSSEVVHFKDLNFKLVNKFDKVILCGTALKDFDYLKDMNLFKWILDFKGDVLGVCAGAQVVGKVFGCKIKPGEEIGLVDIKILYSDNLFRSVDFKEVYCLHSSFVKVNDRFEILAKTKDYIQVFKLKDSKRNVYGVLFHPEVRNKKMIENFVNY